MWRIVSARRQRRGVVDGVHHLQVHRRKGPAPVGAGNLAKFLGERARRAGICNPHLPVPISNEVSKQTILVPGTPWEAVGLDGISLSAPIRRGALFPLTFPPLF